MSKSWVPAQSVLACGVHGLSLSDVHQDTIAVASTLHQDKNKKITPIVTPIYTSSTYKVEGVDHFLDILENGGYIYSRYGNPTCEAAECALRDMEGGAGTLCFSSGMAALATALNFFLSAGDHIIAPNPLYSGVHVLLTKYMAKKYNIEISWVKPGCDIEEYRKLVKPNTKVLYAETPCNPRISVTDLKALADLGNSLEGVVTMVDSTFASPYLLQPCKLGIDIAMHSGTKYIGGHSDVMAGVLTMRSQEMWSDVNKYRIYQGNNLSPFDAMLLLRGIKTLPVRMERHSYNGQKVAEYLEKHPLIDRVFYPGLTSHEGHSVAKQQMKGFGGTMSFEMKGGLEAGKTFIESVRLIQLAVSLGGVESLVEHPASMTHGPMLMSDEERKEGLITDGLIRLSVGLEHVDDLLADLKQALDKVRSYKVVIQIKYAEIHQQRISSFQIMSTTKKDLN